MIFIDPSQIKIPNDWDKNAKLLTTDLKLKKSMVERKTFIGQHEQDTWQHPTILQCFRDVVGNKCWYSEVHLEGADPNIDHFRPKNRVREVDIDANFKNTKKEDRGYWWLSFEWRNYRLAAIHANQYRLAVIYTSQRRVDKDTSGGKSDYFPVQGARAVEETDWDDIIESYLALDPCVKDDVELLWFDPEGRPICAGRQGKAPSEWEKRRVKVTIWLYHLDKNEIQLRRSKYVEEILKDVKKADTSYQLWGPDSPTPDSREQFYFDQKIEEIQIQLADDAPFAGAKRSVVRQALSTYPWIEDHLSL